jgi:guanylate kinase
MKKPKRKSAHRKSSNVKRIARRGLMLVLSSPSGAGKTTLSHRLMKADRKIKLSISVTTRLKRKGETHGKHYFFVEHPNFDAMVKKGDLLEWAEVFGNRYGTPRRPVEKSLDAGHDVLFDLDWQGTQQLREKSRDDVVSVFILPPTATALAKRLKTRAQDSKAVIRSRMDKASDEMSHWPEYDYVIVNDDLEKSFHQLVSILEAERLKRERQTGLSDFVRNLQAKL